VSGAGTALAVSTLQVNALKLRSAKPAAPGKAEYCRSGQDIRRAVELGRRIWNGSSWATGAFLGCPGEGDKIKEVTVS